MPLKSIFTHLFILILFSALIICYSSHGNAQSISAIVAKDNKTNSHLYYSINVACTGMASKVAKERLLKKNYTNFSELCYKTIEKGTYTLIMSSTKNEDGSIRNTYGFGVDSLSEKSLELAIKNLETNNWAWKRKYGYEIIERQTFNACSYDAIRVIARPAKPSGACGVKQDPANFSLVTINSKNDIKKSPAITYIPIPYNDTHSAVLELIYQCTPDNSFYSELKMLSAETENDLNKLIAMQTFANNGKNLTEINILFLSDAEKNELANRSLHEKTLDFTLKKIKEMILELDKQYCDEHPNECEQGKRKKNRIKMSYTGVRG